jgi:hypothetical protein
MATGFIELITSDPTVLHGQAVIRGTRIPLTVVLDCLTAGMSEESLREQHQPEPSPVCPSTHLRVDDNDAVMSETKEPSIVGNRHCPHCGEKLSRFKPSTGTCRRDCKCGKRWTVRFEPNETMTARVGHPVVRVLVEPYIDGRRPKEAKGQEAFNLVFPTEQGPSRRTRRSRATASTHSLDE